jgi:hypothetical protein
MTDVEQDQLERMGIPREKMRTIGLGSIYSRLLEATRNVSSGDT